VPRAFQLLEDPLTERPLGLFNAGCSTALGRFRRFAHRNGALLGEPQWVEGVPEPLLQEVEVQT
jgi:hypothetical protein